MVKNSKNETSLMASRVAVWQNGSVYCIVHIEPEHNPSKSLTKLNHYLMP